MDYTPFPTPPSSILPSLVLKPGYLGCIPDAEQSMVQVRFILMNSFSTSADTLAYLGKEHGDLMAEEDVELVQNKSPKVDAKTLDPVEWSANPDMEW